MRKFFFHNSLSIVFLLLFLFTGTGQFFTGYSHNNEERKEEGHPTLSYQQYVHSGHFIQSTFENWESEFLQMALFVLFTIWLRQKGSSESKSCDGKEEVDRNPDPSRPGAPWPVKKGGLILFIYKHSLTIALLLLFLLSFVLHFYGSLKDENEQLSLKGLLPETMSQYILRPRFWFESFQNWQSEFLSVFTLVVFSIFLRQQGSPQSKPVDAPDYETGE
jgi:hypothetical protein